MARYHVNYEGNPGVCRARKNPCPYASAEEHYPSMTEAREAYEQRMANDILSSPRWTDRIVLKDDYMLLVENTRHRDFFKSWLRDKSGATIGMLHWSQQENRPAVLCDIEVRDGYRDQGNAKRMIEAVEEKIGEKLHTTGSFTPEGFAKLSKTPLNGEYGQLPAKIRFNSMTFVEDWHKLYTEGN